MGTKAVTGWGVGVEMLQVRQRRMFKSKEINMHAGSNFRRHGGVGNLLQKRDPSKERGGIKH